MIRIRSSVLLETKVVLWLVVSVALGAALASAVLLGKPLDARTSYDGPITITRGGTYTGNWQSNNPNTPAVNVRTSQAVTIRNCNIRSNGDLIAADLVGANVTIRNCKGYALYPGAAGRHPGRFLHAEEVRNVVVENNYLQGTSGMYIRKYIGDGTERNSIKVRFNMAKNIDGRKADGRGGFRTGNSDGDFYRVQFLQFNDVRQAPRVEVAWNQVINEPYRSRVEDVISMYISAGRPNDPYNIHDNYIQGAYPARPAQHSFSGGGIMLGDSGSESPSTAPAWIRAYNNQVVSTTNYGIAIANGHDLHYYNNRIVSSGELPDGTKIGAQNVGAYVWNSAESDWQTFYNNKATNNVVGWQKPGSRNDWWLPHCADCSDNRPMSSGRVTRTMEQQEFSIWKNKLSQRKIRVGPLSGVGE